MKPVDIRNENWEAFRTRVAGLRELVWRALHSHGPCTTRELAQRSGIDILTVRPRVTELVQLAFVDILRDQDGEGVYAAISEQTARVRFDFRKEQLSAPERQLPLALR